MKNTIYLWTILMLCAFVTNSHAEEKPMSISEVLKHTPEQLAEKLGNRSEAGENHAARLWASAKRVETDYVLGKTSIQAVQRLNEWRELLNTWQDLKLQARAMESGGGTMWNHMSARNDAWIEMFLAKHVTSLSAQPKGNGKKFETDYLKTINARIDAGVKEFGKDMEYIREQSAPLKAELKNTYSYLQYMLKTLPDGPVKKAVIEMVKPGDK